MGNITVKLFSYFFFFLKTILLIPVDVRKERIYPQSFSNEDRVQLSLSCSHLCNSSLCLYVFRWLQLWLNSLAFGNYFFVKLKRVYIPLIEENSGNSHLWKLCFLCEQTFQSYFFFSATVLPFPLQHTLQGNQGQCSARRTWIFHGFQEQTEIIFFF